MQYAGSFYVLINFTQIATQKKKKKKKSKQTKYETEIHESKGTKPRNRKFLN